MEKDKTTIKGERLSLRHLIFMLLPVFSFLHRAHVISMHTHNQSEQLPYNVTERLPVENEPLTRQNGFLNVTDKSCLVTHCLREWHS